MNAVFLCLGGNLGDRLKNLDRARMQIESRCGKIQRSSSIYETAAWGSDSSKKYLNQVVLIHTKFNEHQLLHRFLSIEEGLGRKRKGKNADRIIDLDILFFNDRIVETEGIVIPHPRLHLRRFVLEPLMEIAPEFSHPFLGEKIRELYRKCEDKLEVKMYHQLLYICIEGNIGSGKTTLAKALADELNALYLPEQFEKNDLLPLFYSDPTTYAFPLEYSFLLGRFQHISDALKTGTRIIVSDYSIYKCLWFARLNLKNRDYRFFKKHFLSIEKQLQAPDLIFYLKTPVKNLLKNIKTRGRSYENNIGEPYLKKVDKEYEEGLKALPQLKKHSFIIKSYHKNLTTELLKKINKKLKSPE